MIYPRNQNQRLHKRVHLCIAPTPMNSMQNSLTHLQWQALNMRERERERERCERRSEDWGLKDRENQRKYDMERDRECGVGDGERKY